MIVEYTARNFEIIRFTDRYGSACTLQQSSLADFTQPGSSAIWFGVGDNRMHIDIKQLEEILPHLLSWKETGSFCAENKEPVQQLPTNAKSGADAGATPNG